MRVLSVANAVALVVSLLLASVTSAPAAASTAADTASCASSVGPGIPPPASLPAGIPGFHATWFGQSGYMSLCPGDTSVATVAYYNTGSNGWVVTTVSGPVPGAGPGRESKVCGARCAAAGPGLSENVICRFRWAKLSEYSGP